MQNLLCCRQIRQKALLAVSKIHKVPQKLNVWKSSVLNCKIKFNVVYIHIDVARIITIFFNDMVQVAHFFNAKEVDTFWHGFKSNVSWEPNKVCLLLLNSIETDREEAWRGNLRLCRASDLCNSFQESDASLISTKEIVLNFFFLSQSPECKFLLIISLFLRSRARLLVTWY